MASAGQVHHAMPYMNHDTDGKYKPRKAIKRKCVDSSSTIINHMINRKFGLRAATCNPHSTYKRLMLPPQALVNNPSTSMASNFCRTAINKQRCPINCVAWTPEGRRLITGNSGGEFTLWNGTAFNFETILQAHEEAVRAMAWSHNDNWMITADHGGVIKYWQTSMTNVQLIQGHREPIRSLSWSPTDFKYVSGSDDATIKVWDFESAREECSLTGHGWDVKCVEYHPSKGLLASGSKDNVVKLWDPKSGSSLSTIHAHKHTVTKVAWNKNGNWLLTGSRDQLIKLYDIRTLKEFAILKGHTREVTSLSWHPVHESLFLSGGYDGNVVYWLVGQEEPIATIHNAHDNAVWDIQWHPVGHIVATASNDHTTKFWCRNRPGDEMKGKHDGGTGMEIDITGNMETSTNEQSGSLRVNLPGMGGLAAATGATVSTNLTGFADISGSMSRTLATAVPAGRRPPPDNYCCNRCGVKGHWLEDCPTKETGGGNTGPPPANYVCKRCNVPGHWISNCPKKNIPPENYTCHTCKQKGHWKQDCPNAGNSNRNNNNNDNGRSQNHYGGPPQNNYGGSSRQQGNAGSILGDMPPPNRRGGLLGTPPRQSGNKRGRYEDDRRDGGGRNRYGP